MLCCTIVQGKYSQAIASYEKSIFVKSRVLGESHPAVASTLLRLAAVMLEQVSGGRERREKREYHPADLLCVYLYLFACMSNVF